MSDVKPLIARAEMLIRASPATVYEAFVDPGITSRFWFTRGSAPVKKVGSKVTWYWDMYGASAEVDVMALEQDRRILVHWPTPVEWKFTPRNEHTFVVITASGFTGPVDEQCSQAVDAMGGFSLVLAGCKAWLEHGIQLNLVEDHNPDHHAQTWKR